MVEINNQRKGGVPRYAGVVGELITDVRKPEIMVMTSFMVSYCNYSITLANLSR